MIPALPRWILPLMVLGIVAVAGRIGWINGRDQVQQQWDHATASAAQSQSELLRKQAAAYTAQVDQGRQREQGLSAKIQEIDRDYTQKIGAQRAHAAAADAAVQRLRSALAARSAATAPRSPGTHPPAASGADDSAAVGQFFGDCAAQYRDVAEQADSIAAQLTGLQSYASAVSAPAGEAHD